MIGVSIWVNLCQGRPSIGMISFGLSCAGLWWLRVVPKEKVLGRTYVQAFEKPGVFVPMTHVRNFVSCLKSY
jgi:hypothetical protein